MQLQKSNNSKLPNNSRLAGSGSRKPKLKLIIIVAMVVLVAVAVLLFVIRPWSQGPQYFVSEKPYLYACSAFTQDDLSNSFAAERSEHEFINEEASLDVTDERTDVDLLELTGQDSVESKCTYGLNVQDDARGELTSNLFEASITQYRDNEAAREAAQSSRPEQAEKLPSFAEQDNSYFVINSLSQNTARPSIEATLVRDNAEIRAKFTSLDQLDDDSLLQGIDDAMVKATDRIGGGSANSPTNFSGSYEYANRKIADICKEISLSELASNIGQIDLKPTKVHDILVSAVRSEEASERVLQTVCFFAFRTAEDRAAQEGKEIPGTEQASAYDNRFPHDITLLLTYFDTAETAQGAITSIRDDLKEEASGTQAVDVNLGDDALKFRRENSATGSNGDYYYIQQGQIVYHFNIISVAQEEPFATEHYNLSDETAGKIFDLLSSIAE